MACPSGVFARYVKSKLSVPKTKFIVQDNLIVRSYSKNCMESKGACRRAIVDIPSKRDPKCPLTCERKKPKKIGILHKIKLKVIEGGTNFGTPFRRVQIEKECGKGDEKEKKQPKLEALPEKEKEKKRKLPAKLEQRPGLQVSILGADTAIGQYTALLLKQCPTIKRLRLYEAVDTKGSECHRDLYSVVQDLKHINTNCHIQAFSCTNNDLDQSLANADIVLMLESGYLNARMPMEQRFSYQAPIVRKYAEAISTECPKAFIIVGASPVDCMVPLVAESLKESGWYDARKLLGSVAVPEMRASTLAARVLCLEPSCTRVPCVGGTEGEALVPLFSKAVDYFDFSVNYSQALTESVRGAAAAVNRDDGVCAKAAELSEAHALAGLVAKVANGLLCIDVPIVSGFVETDPTAVVSTVRFFTSRVELGQTGILKHLLLHRMSNSETTLTDYALSDLQMKQKLTNEWYLRYWCSAERLNRTQTHFLKPKSKYRLRSCASSLL